MKIMSVSVLLTVLFSPGLMAQTIDSDIDNDWPDARYEVHGDGTVTDTVTSLMWMQCSLGQSWSESGCDGTATIYTWKNALEDAESSTFAEYDDWRLPNNKELGSLVAYDRDNPAINTNAFPDTPSEWYWSSSPLSVGDDLSWSFFFSSGANSYDERDGTDGSNVRVRLVRSTQ